MKYLAPLAFLLLACGEIDVTVWVSGPPATVLIDGVEDREVLALQVGVDDCNVG